MLQKLFFVLPLVVAVIAQNTPVSPTYLPGYSPSLASHENLPPFSVSHPIRGEEHPLNTSISVMPGQILQPGLLYKPKIVFVPTSALPTDVSPLRDPVTKKPAVVIPQPPVTVRPPQPFPQPQPTIVYPSYPVTVLPPTRPATVIPPVVVTRAPFTVPPRTPPTVMIVTPRPTGPFKMEFQCPASNGFYSVANSCEAYYECKGFVAERHICPNGLYFNPAARYSVDYTPCASPYEVQCTAGNVIPRPQPQPTGQCPSASGLFGINDGDCSRYLSCDNGLATIMNCPTGLVFNDQVQVCDWPVNVPQCTPNVLKDFSCPAPPVERNGEVSEIVYNYRYGSQCKSFVACQQGRPRLLSCDPGLAFDDASQTCISEHLVQNCASPYSAAPV